MLSSSINFGTIGALQSELPCIATIATSNGKIEDSVANERVEERGGGRMRRSLKLAFACVCFNL